MARPASVKLTKKVGSQTFDIEVPVSSVSAYLRHDWTLVDDGTSETDSAAKAEAGDQVDGGDAFDTENEE